MAVSGVRAAAAMREAMRAAGLGFGKRRGRGVEGWAQPNHYDSLGFGLVPVEGRKVRWCAHLAGKLHLRYRETRDGDEPEDPSALHGRLRKVFEGLGLDVLDVRTGGWSTAWDDDVSYHVTTDRPSWLGPYDTTNVVSTGTPGPILQALVRSSPNGLLVDRKVLPGYQDGTRRLLTREGVELLVATHAANVESRKAHATRVEAGDVGLSRDGTMTLRTLDGGTRSIVPETLVNHWGDAVEAWHVPSRLFHPTLPFEPDAPFTVAGETVASLSFADWDAQHGDEAPWHEPSAAPRP